jgi:uncharacterized protein (DUF2252 family)
MELEERRELGRSVRQSVPRSSHGAWTPAAGRPDPVELVEAQDSDRLEWLVPERRARMSASAFAFFRGAARVMAGDLAAVPHSGLTVQLCGDAHLANFGVFASPERRLVFDLNDFDETLPGPFEWDLKRLAASVAIAGRHRGFPAEACRDLAAASAGAYRKGIGELSERGWLAAWYTHLTADDILAWVRQEKMPSRVVSRTERAIEKATSRDHLRAAAKLVEGTGSARRFKSDPPLLVPVRELATKTPPGEVQAAVEKAFREFRASLDDETGWLLDRYRMVDVAIKVVGVGSVGTRCWVALFAGAHDDDVLLLQVKEANRSVLEEHLPPSRYEHPGRRVVEGQRLMQAVSDLFLGWSGSPVDRHFYWRQLRDWKGSADLETIDLIGLERYAGLCGWTLARAHAVSGDPAAIAGYLGSGDRFDQSIAEFAMRYADQNDSDHRAFVDAIRDGRLETAGAGD